jgi:hypothetical protein
VGLDHVRTADGFLIALEVIGGDGQQVTVYGPAIAYVSPGSSEDLAVIHFVGGDMLDVRADYRALSKVLFAGSRP